jgi:hypothetical protein
MIEGETISLAMQTFLPYQDYILSAECLDNRRLGKQRVEAKQIYLAITDPTYGWQNHPAVRMWRGHESGLAHYGYCICLTWRDRGFNDTLLDWFCARLGEAGDRPAWFGNEAFHAAHRSNLLRKDPLHYSKFGWTESADLPYIWPK